MKFLLIVAAFLCVLNLVVSTPGGHSEGDENAIPQAQADHQDANVTTKWVFTGCSLFPSTDCSGGYYNFVHGYCYPLQITGNGYFGASIKGSSNGDLVRYGTSAACKSSAIDMKYYGFTEYRCYSINAVVNSLGVLSIKCF